MHVQIVGDLGGGYDYPEYQGFWWHNFQSHGREQMKKKAQILWLGLRRVCMCLKQIQSDQNGMGITCNL